MPQETHLFGLFLINLHNFDPAVIKQALTIQQQERPSIGKLAIRSRLLTLQEVMHTLALQADHNEFFGRLAVKSGVLSQKNKRLLLDMQRKQQPKLGEILIEMGVITPAQRDQLLAEYLQLMAPGTVQDEDL